MTKVVNLYQDNYSKYIGRGSMFGNPFVIGKDGTRVEVCKRHKDWLNGWVQHKKEIIVNGYSNKEVIEHLGELKGEILGCFCKPEACHGDFLVELVNSKREGLLD